MLVGATTFCSVTTSPSFCGLTSTAASGFADTSSRPADTLAGDAGTGTAAGTVTAGIAGGAGAGAEVTLMGPGWPFTFCTVFLTGFLEPVFEDGAGVAAGAGATE